MRTLMRCQGDIDVQDKKCGLVHVFLIWYAVQLLPVREFSTGHVMKICSNHCSFSLFRRLSVDVDSNMNSIHELHI